MFISSFKSSFLSIPSSDSEDDLSSLSILDHTIHQNEAYQTSIISMLHLIESRLHLNNLKLDLYDYLKKQKKCSYKKRFWFDQISFYQYDEDADRVPEPLRVLKLIRSQQKKRNISHFLSKIMKELDENIEDIYEEDYFSQKKILSKNLKSLKKSDVPLSSFIYFLPKKDPKEFNWIILAKTANSDWIKSQSFKSLENIELEEPQNYHSKPTVFTGLQLYKSYMYIHKLLPLQTDWSKEDDETLAKAVMMHGCEDWKQISNYLDGKDTGSCFQRWYKYVNPSITKGKWTILEDIKLALYLEFYGKGKWSLIAKKFENRTDVQIRERWCNILDPHLKIGNKWRPDEDEMLLKEAPLNNFKWAIIASKFEGRTDNQCARRYKKLTVKRKKTKRTVIDIINEKKEQEKLEMWPQTNFTEKNPPIKITLKEAIEKKLPIFQIISVKKEINLFKTN